MLSLIRRLLFSLTPPPGLPLPPPREAFRRGRFWVARLGHYWAVLEDDPADPGNAWVVDEWALSASAFRDAARRAEEDVRGGRP